MRQLAFNITKSNFEEGLRYSELILDIFGEEPFDLELLKKAFSELTPDEELALAIEYKLFKTDKIDFFAKTSLSAKKKLFELNENYHFLLVTKISFLEKERAKIICQYISDNNILLECTDLNFCIIRTLQKSGINTVAELVCHTYEEIAHIKNIGIKKLDKIQEMLSNYNLTLD